MYIWLPGDLVKMQVPIQQVRAGAWDYAFNALPGDATAALHEPHAGLSMSQILVVFPSEQGHDPIYQNLQPPHIINTDHLGVYLPNQRTLHFSKAFPVPCVCWPSLSTWSIHTEGVWHDSRGPWRTVSTPDDGEWGESIPTVFRVYVFISTFKISQFRGGLFYNRVY